MVIKGTCTCTRSFGLSPFLSPFQNYENMFYSYFFPTGPRSTQTFEPRFTSGAGTHPISGKKEQWLGMSFNSKFDGDGIKEHGRPHLNVSIGEQSYVVS